MLPWLVEAFGDGIVDVLARQAVVSREDAEWFELVATETAARLVIEEGGAVRMEQAALDALHPAIGRRVVLAALRRAAAGKFVGFEHVEAVLALSRETGAIDLPGQRVSCRQGWLCFEAQAPDPGRGGRRRGRASAHGHEQAGAIGAAAVSKSEGERARPAGPDVDHPRTGRTPAGGRAGRRDPRANVGPKCAEDVSLEGHAPKGGRG